MAETRDEIILENYSMSKMVPPKTNACYSTTPKKVFYTWHPKISAMCDVKMKNGRTSHDSITADVVFMSAFSAQKCK